MCAKIPFFTLTLKAEQAENCGVFNIELYLINIEFFHLKNLYFWASKQLDHELKILETNG